MRRVLVCVLGCIGVAPAFAHAQSAPLPAFVIDVRGAIPMLGHSAESAASLGVDKADVPGRALGAVAGVHGYPLRTKGFALGLGGEYLLGRATNQPTDANGKALGSAIERRVKALSGQFSLNFGHRRGWSYLTGGTGSGTFDTYLAGATPSLERRTTVNYGGGARWFTSTHLAFTLDLRYYKFPAANATSSTAARPKGRIMVFSVGIAAK